MVSFQLNMQLTGINFSDFFPPQTHNRKLRFELFDDIHATDYEIKIVLPSQRIICGAQHCKIIHSDSNSKEQPPKFIDNNIHRNLVVPLNVLGLSLSLYIFS